jgi:uridine phosphorylase
MHRHDFPILEHDLTREAFLEPSRINAPVEGFPERVVLCFFQEVIANVGADAPVIKHLVSEVGRFPVHVLEVKGERIAIAHPGVGAAYAAAVLEELIAFGGRKFIAVGSAGSLMQAITVGHVVIPTSAIRDEGTSYHYLPPSREVTHQPAGIAAIKATLTAHDVPYASGKTWTTDGLYRETPARIARRREEGCVTVEMEAAAFFAVAEFRGVTFGQMLYGGDDLSGDEWDMRDFLHGQATQREKLFWLATDACLRL